MIHSHFARVCTFVASTTVAACGAIEVSVDANLEASPDAISVPCLPVAGQDERNDLTITLSTSSEASIDQALALIDGSEGPGELFIIPESVKSSFGVELSLTDEVTQSHCVLGGQARISGRLSDHLSLTEPFAPSLHVALDGGALFGSEEFRLFAPNKLILEELFAGAIFRAAGLYVPTLRPLRIRYKGHNYIALFQDFDDARVVDQGFRNGPTFEFNEDGLWMFGSGYSEPSMTFQIDSEAYSKESREATAISLKALATLQESLWWTSIPGTFGNRTPIVFPKDARSRLNLGKFAILSAVANGAHGLELHNRKFLVDPFSGEITPLWNDLDPSALATMWAKRDSTETVSRIAQREPGVREALELTDTWLDSAFWSRLTEDWFHIVSHPAIQDYLVYDYAKALPGSRQIKMYSDEPAALLDQFRSHVSGVLGVMRETLSSGESENFLTTKAAEIITDDLEQRWIPEIRDFLQVGEMVVSNEAIHSVARGGDIEGEVCLYGKYGMVAGSCTSLVSRGNNLRELMQQSGRVAVSDYEEARVVLLTQAVQLDYASEAGSAWRRTDVENLLVTGDVDVDVTDEDGRLVVDIAHLSADARSVFFEATLDQVDIRVRSKGTLLRRVPDEHEITVDGLTGCLTFLNSHLNSVQIAIRGSQCEDGVHFDVSTGSIDRLEVAFALADAIDADRSNLIFSEVFVSAARNDCIDLSDGTYLIAFMELVDCADKGLSAGEDAVVRVQGGSIESHLGIVGKDGARIEVSGSLNVDAGYCVAMYNKKYGFSLPILNRAELVLCE